MFEKELEYIKDILYSRGYKLTVQRRNIIDFFLKNPEKHFSPMELHVKIRNKGLKISIATVYRNIKILTDNNIIEEICHGEEKLYELKIFGRKSIHVHTSCLRCNKIRNYVDIRASFEIVQQMNELEKEHFFQLSKAEIFLKGICSECQMGGESYS